jgi:hypothetical protein
LAVEALVSNDGVECLTVRVCNGCMIGVVVGVFTDGPLVGRLRVQGDDAPRHHKRGAQDGIAVYAIPRRSVARRLGDCLVLDVPLSTARGRWLMHVYAEFYQKLLQVQRCIW